MKRYGVALVLLTVPFHASCTQPRGMYKSATVTIVDSTPCFSVEDSRETRHSPPKVAGLTVLRELEAGSEKVWALDLTQTEPAIQLAPPDCLRYGESVPGAQVVHPSEQLRVGERYSMYINAFIEDPDSREETWHNRVYSLNFCLILDEESKLQARTVSWSNGNWAWERCDQAPVSDALYDH